MIQLKNALHVQPIETTLHITFYLILFHKSLLSKISNQNVKKKASIARFKYSSKTYITIYTWHFPFLHSKNKFTDLSEISPLPPFSQQFHSPTDATTVPSVFKERKRGEYSLERIEISSNHFATPTSNTFAVIPISHGWNSPRRSINQPDKRDGFEA